MRWKIPDDWELPPNEVCYQRYKDRGELYSMTKPEYDIACKHINNKRTAIDVGAHVGTTALRYAQDFETVHAFEPVYFDLLEKNIGYADNIIIHPHAASDNNDPHVMVKSAKNSGATVVKGPENAPKLRSKRFDQHEIKISCITIDSLGLTDVDFIKLDTEGFVLPVLEGMKQTLKNSNFPVLQIEFNEMTVNEHGCLNFLAGLGYEQCDKYVKVDRFYRHRGEK